MTDDLKRIREHFADSARLKLDAADALAPEIARGIGRHGAVAQGGD